MGDKTLTFRCVDLLEATMVKHYNLALFSLTVLILLCMNGRGHAQNYWQGFYNCEAYNRTHGQHYDCSAFSRGYQYNAQPYGVPDPAVPPQCLAQNNQAPKFRLDAECDQI